METELAGLTLNEEDVVLQIQVEQNTKREARVFRNGEEDSIHVFRQCLTTIKVIWSSRNKLIHERKLKSKGSYHKKSKDIWLNLKG
ncbi:hypothetical protein J1N35_017448 [Gossypium stocksii]|uniref:Uncharacterized protein n=1 Tax=Gossypium stocksii TaxID=47602 RepID=A0A9D4A682_9ROSI|nr:hypothetical protein J1N35_017448 [Gossypium stocksii]